MRENTAAYSILAVGILLAGAVVWAVVGTSSYRSTPADSGKFVMPTIPFTPPPVVTRAHYAQISEGMSYERVRGIIGNSGEEVSRATLAGHTTIMYQWMNANGSGMNAMFQNGRLVTKAQMGLP
jgi:hypothetical protein